MKTKTILVAFASLLIGSQYSWACQKDESLLGKPDTTENIQLKTEQADPDCNSHCIDQADPVYFEKTDKQNISWSGCQNNEYSKILAARYHNTLTHFVKEVMSLNDIDIVLVNEESVKDFSNSIPAGIVTGAGYYMAGEEVDLAATAIDSYEFVNWTTDDDAEISDQADFTYNLPAMSKTLIENFEEEDVFVCGVSKITDADGNVYNTVLIGDQCWIRENLKTAQYRNGTPIKYPGTDNSAWTENTTGAFAWYNNDMDWKDYYGALYNWYAATNIAGLCPAGWSVPNYDDWKQLVNYVWDQGFSNEWHNPIGAGNALRSCWQVDSPLGGDCDTSVHPRWNSHDKHHGFDEFGFSALPGGSRDPAVSFTGLGEYSTWWTTTEWEYSGYTDAWSRGIGAEGTVSGRTIIKNTGLSIRCIRDVVDSDDD